MSTYFFPKADGPPCTIKTILLTEESTLSTSVNYLQDFLHFSWLPPFRPMFVLSHPVVHIHFKCRPIIYVFCISLVHSELDIPDPALTLWLRHLCLFHWCELWLIICKWYQISSFLLIYLFTNFRIGQWRHQRSASTERPGWHLHGRGRQRRRPSSSSALTNPASR